MGNICPVCKKTFPPKYSHHRFCSNECKNKYWNKYLKSGLNLPNQTVGAISELLASVDLMKKGYEVYRALSPSSSCDIFALKNKISKKFEVRTGYYLPNKKIRYPKENIRAENISVVTLSDGKIHYFPDLDD